MSPSAAYCPYWGWSGHRYAGDDGLTCVCGAVPPLEDIVEVDPDVIDRAAEALGID